MKNIGVAIVALFALCCFSLFVGVQEVSITDWWQESQNTDLFLISRIPRTLAVVLTGASLAVSGAVMQMLARNNFVEPSSVGTAQSAALGILLVTLLYPASPLIVKMIVAAATAMIGMAVFLAMISRLPVTSPLLVPLVGLIFAGIVEALTVFIAFQTDMLQFQGTWMSGEFSGILRGRYELLWLCGGLAILTYVVADQFTIIGMGKDASINLGLNYKQVVILGLFILALSTSLIVVTVGMIPFVGLVVPNIARRMMGDNLRASLPWVAVLGALLVLTCDLIGRLVHFPYEIPVGTVLGVIGSFVFLYLLYARPAHAR
ncbi:ABC transporter permease [Pseudovibrio brasiliensis]|uniref:Iron chelate uptake ABC transporter family permease subunit n=1 Tax=Pseudovibrio brasiliensis TaxID=1898042 RepID=A0ABX8ARQ5_9HYPH|nr:iron chelate uptake ABC transporter family permease subunit [Pseudovibrio brasiliensis]QUS57787.1 iron chelate uptake ABC transporter family permease subunit [Pseudovibrio brasiliensis]